MASATDLVNSATSEKLAEMDWTKNIHICELVAHDQRVAKDVVKALKKRLSSKHANTQLYAVLLLEMLMNNIGENIHNQVVDSGILPILVKIVKKKTEMAVRERIFLLLDATQTSLGGASGKFPQYYTAYYDLVSAGVQFAQSPTTVSSTYPISEPNQSRSAPPNQSRSAPPNQSRSAPPNPSRSAPPDQKRNAPPNQNRSAPPNGELPSSTQDSQEVPESSIIQKASNALEVLKEVLDAVESQRSEGAKDEFTLDLVEQCSFQKQRVMHLVMASRDEKVVSRAIELNEQLQKVLTRHDVLLSAGPTSAVNRVSQEEVEEEEEPEQLFRRLRKGKACARPEDEERVPGPHVGPGEMQNRPLIRPLSLDGSAIPPPPAKHVEREKYFQENKSDGLAGHVRALSLHSRNASSSRSGDSD